MQTKIEWEYKVYFPRDDEAEFAMPDGSWETSLAKFLNEQGKDGWELVSFELNVPTSAHWFHAIFARSNEYVIETLG